MIHKYFIDMINTKVKEENKLPEEITDIILTKIAEKTNEEII